MSDLLLFIIGFVITFATLAAVLLIGRSEAKDPALNREYESNAIEHVEQAAG